MNSDRVSEAPRTEHSERERQRDSFERREQDRARGDDRHAHRDHERPALERREGGGEAAERMKRGTWLDDHSERRGNVKVGGGEQRPTGGPRGAGGPTPEELEAKQKKSEADQKKRDAEIAEKERRLRALQRRAG